MTDPLSESDRGVPAPATGSAEDRPDASGNLRRRAARGTIINSAFQVGLAGVGLLQRVVVVAFLTREEFGLWGIIVSTLITLSWLKQVGIADKYIQQSEPDQEAAFQKAFTLELIVSCLFFALALLLLPLYGLAYGHSEMIVPGMVLAASVPITTFETPIWIRYRRLEFVMQRTLSAVNPVVALLATVALGVAGLGYWCLVLGVLIGSIAGASVAIATSPYPLRLRFERSSVKEYARFSWPLLGHAGSSLLIVQGTMLIANRTVGLAGLGAIGLAGSIATFADRVDRIISQTIYPAVCRVADRIEVLHEAFVKSNRVTLMWAIPFGVGLALFAGDLVTYAFGDSWRAAEGLLVGIGLIAAINQIAFNWTIFMRALDDTRPIFIGALAGFASFALVMVPALLTLDLAGYVVGYAAATSIQLAVRGFFLRRIFKGFGIVRHLLRAIAPSIPAAGAILSIRMLGIGGETLAMALAELLTYVMLTALLTWLFERELIRELWGYLRGEPRQRPSPVITKGAQEKPSRP